MPSPRPPPTGATRQQRSGHRSNPILDVIAALCDVFDVSPTYFHDTGQADDIVNALKTLQTAGAQAILTHGEGTLPPDTLRRIAEAIESGDSTTR